MNHKNHDPILQLFETLDQLNDAAEDTLDKIISRQSPHAHPSPSPNRVIECLVSGEKGDTDAK